MRGNLHVKAEKDATQPFLDVCLCARLDRNNNEQQAFFENLNCLLIMLLYQTILKLFGKTLRFSDKIFFYYYFQRTVSLQNADRVSKLFWSFENARFSYRDESEMTLRYFGDGIKPATK